MSLAPLIPTVISILFVLVGWKVVYNNAKKLASRSETYAIVNRLITLLNDVQKLSEEFWLKAEYKETPQNYDLLVLSKTKLISAKLDTLKGRGIDIYELQRLVFPLRKACTLNSYNIDKLSEDAKREQVDGILVSISNFEKQLDSKMTSLYPPNY